MTKHFWLPKSKSWHKVPWGDARVDGGHFWDKDYGLVSACIEGSKGYWTFKIVGYDGSVSHVYQCHVPLGSLRAAKAEADRQVRMMYQELIEKTTY